TYKNIHFELSDVELEQRSQSTDSKGNTTTSYQTYFKGRWYIFTFERIFNEVLKIIEGKGYQMSKKDLEKVETESMEFNKKFTVYASSQNYAFYHITPIMIEKLLSLEKMHRGSILYCFKHNELHIGVNDRKDYLELSIKKPVNEKAIIDFEQDIDLISAIIDVLDLDSNKFKNTEPKGEL
ncbi:MAG: DUF3137 domain-containing protein, partial [Acholeplasmataceae bacterium]|nr:DUF3137 domain-containing protein [Acholeplasmataceae bacterium]